MASEECKEYQDWFNTAERNGVIDEAVIAYYAPSDQMYEYEVNGRRVQVPIFSKGKWLTDEHTFEELEGRRRDTEIIDVDESAVSEQIERIKQRENVSGDEVPLFNGDVAISSPRMVDGIPQIDIIQSDYFSKLTSDYRFRDEVLQVLYSYDLAPDAGKERIQELVEEASFSNRDVEAPDFQSIVDSLDEHATPFGINTLVVFNTGSGYKLLVSKRGPTLALYPDWWHPIPCGGMELPSGEENVFKYTIQKEFAEEVLSAPEDASEVWSEEGMRELRSLLDSGEAHLDCTGVTVTATRLGLNANALLFIEDPEYFEKYVTAENLDNFENQDWELVDITDEGSLEWILSTDTCAPVTLPCVVEGLLHLESAYDIQCSVDLTSGISGAE